MKEFRKFIRFRKVDEEKREVYGMVTDETPDLDGEICDYESSKPYYEKWSDAAVKRSKGKSLGNVREMHSKVAAGHLTRIDFEDPAKEIWVVTYVSDDNSWEKCKDGTLTGYSHAGKFQAMKKDGKYLRYTANPIEISLVDMPCNPNATFEYVKAGGSRELRKSVGGKGKLEIKLETPMMKDANDTRSLPLQKSMYDVATLARILCDINYLQNNAMYEAAYEEDDSTQPAELSAWLKQGVAILAAMVDEEGAEMLEAKAARGEFSKAKSMKAHYKFKATHHKKMAKAMDHCPDAQELHKAMCEHYQKMADEPEDRDGKSVVAPTGKAAGITEDSMEKETAKALVDGLNNLAELVKKSIEAKPAEPAAKAAEPPKEEKAAKPAETAKPEAGDSALKALEAKVDKLGELFGKFLDGMSKSATAEEIPQRKTMAAGAGLHAVPKEADTGNKGEKAAAAADDSPISLIKAAQANPTIVRPGESGGGFVARQ